MNEKDLGLNRGVLDCSCDLSSWRDGIMTVPSWCKAHRLLYAFFNSMARYS